MTKKFFTVACCLCMAAGVFAQSYSGGDGTASDPYRISSKVDMEALAAAVNGSASYSSGKYFLLTENLTGVTTIIGTDNAYPFRGTFDGDGHTLDVTISSTAQYVGVFGHANGATIKNLGVAGSVARTSASGRAYTGGICGYMAGNGSISSCHNEASVSASSTNNTSYSGGICGYSGSPISNCYNAGGSVSSSSNSNSTSSSGGICGVTAPSSPISNCYNTGGSISSSSNSSGSTSNSLSGGICGNSQSSPSILNCFVANATVTASGIVSAGRIVGNAYYAAAPINNYAQSDMKVNGQTVSDSDNNGKGEDVANFKDLSWLEGTLGWDVSKWYIPAGGGFPMLKVIGYSGGTGAVNEPYLISSVADMEALAAKVNSGKDYSGAYFLLTGDLEGITTIIGVDNAHPFKGNFDGGGHVLDVAISTAGAYAGVFGYANGATIKNLGVTGSVTRTEQGSAAYAGGICGYLDNGGSITGCYSTASVSASADWKSYSGGICGYMEGSSITGCYNTASVDASTPGNADSYSGGICGLADSYSSIGNCYNTGDISSNAGANSYAGGICGLANNDSEIINCFAANASIVATGNAKIGRIVGGFLYSVLTNSYALSDMMVNGITGSHLVDGQDATMANFSDPSWLAGTLTWNMTDWYVPAGASFPVLKAFAYSEGEGTAQNPYRISSVAEMETLAAIVNSGTDYVGKYFLLTADLTGVTTIIGVDNAHPFKGSFDGGGHLVTVNISTAAQYAGVFGYAENATIKNLGVAGSVERTNAGGEAYAGGICGYMKVNGSITGCYNMASVSGAYGSGGICGLAYASISNCYNTGEISAALYGGGICGRIESPSSISNCYNTGKISSERSGGICGTANSSFISNCYNMGAVFSTTSAYYGAANGGGICGLSYASISNCYNAGEISAASTGGNSQAYSGGICGSALAPSIDNCFAANARITATVVAYTNSTAAAKRIVGHIYGTLTNNYAYSGMQANGNTVSNSDDNGQGEDIASFQSLAWLQSTLPLWDMNNTWYVPDGGGYPELRANPGLHLALSPNTVTYGSDPLPIASSSPAWAPVEYTSSDNTIAEVVSGLIQIKRAGTVTIWATRAGTATYGPARMGAPLTINKAPLTITGKSETMTYGGPLPSAYTCTYSGFVNGEDETTAGVLSNLPTVDCTATATSNAGGYYPITVSGATADNYEITHNPGTLTINKKSLTVTPNPAIASREYGDNNPTFAVTYSADFVNGDDEGDINIPPQASCAATPLSDVGNNYTITTSGGSADNYDFIYDTGTLEITKAPLEIETNSDSRIYGVPNPVFTFSFDGFKNSEDETVLDNLTAICGATLASPVGPYQITFSVDAPVNYEITPVYGELSVTQAALTITANNLSREYGAANPTFTFSFDGFKNSEDEGILTNLEAACSATVASGVGQYPITVSVDAATNYAISTFDGELSVTPATLVVTAKPASRIYGAANPTFEFSYIDFVNGDDETVLLTLPQADCAATPASGIGDYTIYVSGGSATNYSLAYTHGTLTINKAPLSVSGYDAYRNYGESNPAFSIAYSGFVNGDSETSLIAQPQASSAATKATDVGYYPINISGGVAANYDFAYYPGLLFINKAPLTVTAQAAASVYGDALPAFACQYSGFVNGETESVLWQLPSLASNATPLSDAGTYSIIPSGATAQNYTFEYQNGTLTIGKAPLIITADDATRFRGEDNPPFTLSYSGFKNSETETVLDLLPTITCVADPTSPVGFYDILLSGGYDNNYDYSLINGQLSVTNPTAIGEVSAAEVSIYPNPVKHVMYIQSESPIEKVEIYTQAGILALTDKAPGGKIDVSRLAAGVYFVRVYVNGGVEIRKVIVGG